MAAAVDAAAEGFVYLKQYKPRNVLSSMVAHGGKNPAASFLPPQWQQSRVRHVGRLDYESEGLLIWTNDKAFSRLLTSPSAAICKTYDVLIEDKKWPWRKKAFGEADLCQLTQGGVPIGDSYRRGPALFDPQSQILDRTPCGRCLVRVRLREGRKREIRRVFYELDFRVVLLRRVAIGEGPHAISLWSSSGGGGEGGGGPGVEGVKGVEGGPDGNDHREGSADSNDHFEGSADSNDHFEGSTSALAPPSSSPSSPPPPPPSSSSSSSSLRHCSAMAELERTGGPLLTGAERERFFDTPQLLANDQCSSNSDGPSEPSPPLAATARRVILTQQQQVVHPASHPELCVGEVAFLSAQEVAALVNGHRPL